MRVLQKAAARKFSSRTYAFSPMPRPPLLDVGIALVTLAHVAPRRLAAPEIAGGGEPAPMPSKDWPSNNLPSNDLPSEDLPSAERPTEDRPGEDWHGVAGETHSEPAMATLPDAAAEQNFEPLTSALDVAARLAADASVAADALENLKRVLEHKQLLESQHPLLAAIPAAASDNPETPASGFDAPTPPALPPLPLPLHAMSDAGGGSAGGSPMLLPPPRRRLPPERRGLDVRGFFAGFALSWAFGVVLYLFMTAG